MMFLALLNIKKPLGTAKIEETLVYIFGVSQQNDSGDGQQNYFVVLGSKVEQCGAHRVHAYEIPVGH